jgi:hypothetical protein
MALLVARPPRPDGRGAEESHTLKKVAGIDLWGAHSCTGALPLPIDFQPFGLWSRVVSFQPGGLGVSVSVSCQRVLQPGGLSVSSRWPAQRRHRSRRVRQPGGLGVSSRWPAQRRHRSRWRRYCSTTPKGSNDVGAHRPTSSRRRAHGPHRWAGRLCDPFGVVTNRGAHSCTGALPLPTCFQPFGLGVSVSFSRQRVLQPGGLSVSVSFSPEGWPSACPSARRAERQ